MSHHDKAHTIGKRPKRQRSYSGRNHTCSISKKTWKLGNNHDMNLRPNNIPQGTPPFITKIYGIINICNKDIAGWTKDGKMFVIKDTNRFENEIIPSYFEAKKFSSFVRQLNFYRFRKIQDKPIRKADIDISTTGYVKWYHDNFQRDTPELLCKINRSIAGGGDAYKFEEQQQKIDHLKKQVTSYEELVTQLRSKIDLMEENFFILTQQFSQNKSYHELGEVELMLSKSRLEDHPKTKKELPPEWNHSLDSLISAPFRELSVESNHSLDSLIYNTFKHAEMEI